MLTLDNQEVELIADATAGTAEFLNGDLASDLACYRALRPKAWCGLVADEGGDA